MQIISQVYGNENTGWGGVDTHVVGCVVEELGTAVSLDIVTVEVSPPQLHIKPKLLRRCAVHRVSEKEN